jgi:hypothetical protein
VTRSSKEAKKSPLSTVRSTVGRDLGQLRVHRRRAPADDDQVRLERVDRLVVRLEQGADLGVLVLAVVRQRLGEDGVGHAGDLDTQVVQRRQDADVEDDDGLRVDGDRGLALGVGDGDLGRAVARRLGGLGRATGRQGQHRGQGEGEGRERPGSGAHRAPVGLR